MCGITGILGPADAHQGADHIAVASRMADTLLHRGPDDGGVWQSPDRLITLAHRRLSIVDLSPLGRNPMLWDGGRLAITYNGEIYNFRELRRELQLRGHRFRSETDTEVVLAAYDEWGIDSLTRLAGMFAFALWDAPRRRLWLVRDRVGKKPLYYASRNGVLSFASELKALAMLPDFVRRIDVDALRMYLKYGYVPAPHTIFAGVQKLEPGHYLLCENGTVSITRYWDPFDYVANGRTISDADAESGLEELLATAVRQRLVADVPLGAFLSGGIDSSLIVALMGEQRGAPVDTYTIRFEDAEYDESAHAAAVARHLGTVHHETPCSDKEMVSVVDRIPEMFDEPFGDSSAIPTFIVSKAAREGVTVALSGDGGDELFLGYPRYRHFADAAWACALPAPARRVLAEMAKRMPGRRTRRIADVLTHEDDDIYSRFIAMFPSSAIRQASGEDSKEPSPYRVMRERVERRVPRALQPGLLDMVSYLPDDILTKVDRASMAVSLEVRCPLLDHRVVEFALGLPIEMKRRQGSMKWLLRRLLYKRVPRELVDRPKMGFGVPLGRWFEGPLRERMADYMAGDDLRSVGLDPRPFRAMWDSFSAGGVCRPDLLWQTFVLVAWARQCMTARRAA